MDTITRIPAFPLITHDPMFSVWHNGDLPTGEETTHWTGIKKRFRGFLTVDGQKYRFLGRNNGSPMRLISSKVTPLSTQYVFQMAGIQLTLRFTSPLLLDDLDILSTPVSYISFDVVSIDNSSHDVSLEFHVSGDICHSGEYEPEMRSDIFSDDNLNYGYMGQVYQKPLSSSGDQTTCDWGYMFMASSDSIDTAPERNLTMLRYRKKAQTNFSALLLVGYDEVTSINYFGKLLPSYYARQGKTITQALREFYDRREEILSRCNRFDAALLSEASKKGGEDYALILSAAYRQTVAAHKLVADTDGTPLFISKENDSNGCAATVDVSYPSIPLFLLFQPDLVRGMLRPIFKFARMPVWTYDFAPHDVGRYPILTGQVYGADPRINRKSIGTVYPPYYIYPATGNIYAHSMQMPVEESADILLMLAACGKADGDYSLASDNLDLLYKWCDYLLKFGEDPGEQLCTDDFAGHLAHNVNLSAKAIMGVAAFGQILEALDNTQDATKYFHKAKNMAQSWLARADVGGYTSLSFDGSGWSMKYNLVWDRLLGFHLLPDDFYHRELSSYIPRMNRYGLPLDSRASYSKTDWILWTAAMANDDDFSKFTAPIAKYLRESGSRVPFSDYYDTETGLYERFIARSVQGGLFMPLLMDRWTRT